MRRHLHQETEVGGGREGGMKSAKQEGGVEAFFPHKKKIILLLRFNN